MPGLIRAFDSTSPGRMGHFSVGPLGALAATFAAPSAPVPNVERLEVHTDLLQNGFVS